MTDEPNKGEVVGLTAELDERIEQLEQRLLGAGLPQHLIALIQTDVRLEMLVDALVPAIQREAFDTHCKARLYRQYEALWDEHSQPKLLTPGPGA